MTFELDWLKCWDLYSPLSVAIQDGDTGVAFTYREFYQRASRGAAFLQSLGIKKGDRVAALSLNELDYVVLFFALQRLGAILVPMNFRLTTREVDHILGDCSPSLIVYQEEFGSALSTFSKKILMSDFSRKTSENFKIEIPFAAEAEDPA